MNPSDGEARKPDPYRSVVFVLLAAAIVGTASAIVGAVQLAMPVLFAIALLVALAAGILAGVATAQSIRSRPARLPRQAEPHEATPLRSPQPEPAPFAPGSFDTALALRVAQRIRFRLTTLSRNAMVPFRDGRLLDIIRYVTAGAGTLGVIGLTLLKVAEYPPGTWAAGIAAGGCVVGAVIAATAARYLGGVDPLIFPESPGLRQGGRVAAWILLFAALATGLAWTNRQSFNRVIFYAVVFVAASACYGLIAARRPRAQIAVFPVDLGILSFLGRRANIFAGILDSAEQQLGIDLRSTWALTVIRRSLEPLALGLALVAWLSTSATVIGIEEQGLIERLGVPVGGEPLSPGLHLHLPWPVEKVFRVPVRRVQLIEVGHEGAEAPGPENVLWAVEHAPNEFTLLLGNGRDLITVDAGVQFRIRDASAWHYHCQNPNQALSAIAYRAVMRNTVNLTLSDALSQNLKALTGRMKAMIQQEADKLGLGVEILGFTVGGMHPPVAVARDYQAVVSSELRKVTTVVNAGVYKARLLPETEAEAIVGANKALADSAEALGKAAGEAWAFRTVEAQYKASPALYLFRRRLETLEHGLAGRDFTILDSRFQRDGGEVWLTP